MCRIWIRKWTLEDNVMSSLPCGVTDSMCEAGLIDENQPCGGCAHELYWHDEEEFCECCRKEHESCDYVYLCHDHSAGKPDEKEFTWYCSKNYKRASDHKRLKNKNCNHKGCMKCATWENLGKDLGTLYGKAYRVLEDVGDADENWSLVYEKTKFAKKFEAKHKSWHIRIDGHTEAMEKWREEVKDCCKKKGEDEYGRDLCKQCDCKVYDDVPPEPDYEDDDR